MKSKFSLCVVEFGAGIAVGTWMCFCCRVLAVAVGARLYLSFAAAYNFEICPWFCSKKVCGMAKVGLSSLMMVSV